LRGENVPEQEKTPGQIAEERIKPDHYEPARYMDAKRMDLSNLDLTELPESLGRLAQRRWDVLGFGAVAVDDILYVDSYPAPDSKTRVRAKRREGGGLTGTALVAAARLGARAAYCGVLGEDELSRFTLEQLEREGVDCLPVLRRATARPYHSVIVVDRSTGQRSVLASDEGVVDYPVAEVTDELISNCRVLFVDHHGVETACRAARLAHRRGIPVVADIERLNVDGIHDLIALVDHLVIGIELGHRLSGESEPQAIVSKLLHQDRTCCVVTDGARGCWYAANEGAARHVPAIPIQVVDTTGCGDVFHGVYAACIAQGEAVDTAIQVATAAAGLKATQPGGRSGIPDRAAIDHLIGTRNCGDGGADAAPVD
jgi:sulfofructose kinase